MSVDKLVDSTQLDSDLTSVANAIRTKGGTSSQMSFPSGFVSAIENIHTGSTPTGTKEISITENGTTTEDVTDYAYAEIEVAVPASAVDSGTKNITANGTGQDVVGYAAVDVAVPNTYAAGDEGKVVSSGALVAQTSGSTSANGTVDTTLINSLSVSVPASAVVSGTLTVDSSGTKDVTSYQYASVPAGTAGTPTATKGTVSNHAVTVTPSVTNSAGWVGSETKTGTAVTVQASELVSGSQTIQTNDTYDVTNLASVTVNVSGVSLVDVIKRTAPSGNVTIDDTTSFDIRPYFFQGYSGMTSLASNKASKLQSYAFQNCTGLTAINCPGTTRVEASCFEGCSNLSSIILSKNYDLSGGNQFRQCSSLQDFVFWGNGTGKTMCYECSSLRAIDIAHANVYNIAESCFYNCLALKTIILRKTSGVILLANINAFSGTPFANGGIGGDIYVPKTLYDALGTGTNDYKAASNWSTINGYGTITWHAIEGSYYETHYADGTLIPTT